MFNIFPQATLHNLFKLADTHILMCQCQSVLELEKIVHYSLRENVVSSLKREQEHHTFMIYSLITVLIMVLENTM